MVDSAKRIDAGAAKYRDSRPPVICIAGPTAAGKTEIAIELVKRFPCDIISVDSALVYRQMNIGTAKPSPDVMAIAPHSLVDIRDPWERYSAGEFCRDARELIDSIHARGRIPLMVGGTFLYFRALLKGLAPLPTANPAMRAEIDRRASELGWPALHAELAQLDPVAAARINPNDRQRLQRALEVIHLTGEPVSRLQSVVVDSPDLDFIRVALVPGNRAALHERIETRLRGMLDAGFIEEVESLRALPQMGGDCMAMRAVGYRQLWAYLDGQVSRDDAVNSAIVATRRLAKRQLTWLRSEECSMEFDCQADDLAATISAAVSPYLASYDA
jgi:tRNA dimethylallyltransferase